SLPLSSQADAAHEACASRSLPVFGLDGSRASLEASLSAIREIRPKQVMLETCEQRRLLVERRPPAVLAEGAESEARASPVLLHADAIASVHGGLRSEDLLAVSAAASEVGAQIYPVDRPYQDTQNRVARRLLLHPRELLGFARHSVSLLTRPPSGDQGPAVESCPPAVASILGIERERYMAAEASRRAVRGAEALVVCTASRAEGLRELLSAGSSPSSGAAKSGDSNTTRIWPFLLILVYVVIPAYGSVFVCWRGARWMA
ncbi:unnamed protein product, partial [Polarella glacialis]